MSERSQAMDEYAVHDAVPAYRVAPVDTTLDDVPPGYKRTEVGVVPAQWEVRSLSSLSAFITKGSTPTTYGFKWEDGGRLFLRSECVSANGLDLSESMLISEAAHHFLRRSAVRDGDVLITITGNVGRVVFLNGVGEANINQHIARIRVTENNADNRYVFQYLSQTTVRKTFEKITTGQAYPQISLEQVRNALVPLPKLDEQRAIATALSDADALIESLDRLIAKKGAIKQAAMQQLLTGVTRLPGFDGNWCTARLGDLGATYGGLTGKTKADFGAGPAFYVPFMNVMGNVVVDCFALERVRVDSGEGQNQVRRGDLLFNGSSETPEELAMCALMDAEHSNLYLNSFCFGFRLHEDALANPLFLAYFIRSPEGRELMKSLAQGSTRYNLSKSALLNSSITIPPFHEQVAIANVLSDMDAEIEALERRRHKAHQIKQGMMQQLLAGRVRLAC